MKGKNGIKGLKVLVILMLTLAMLLSSCTHKADDCSDPKYATSMQRGG